MLSLVQRQSQQLRLTPQQLQFLKLLQLPLMALEQRVKQELEENPLLEEVAEETLEEVIAGDVVEEVREEGDAVEREEIDTETERTEETGEREELDWEEYLPQDAADDERNSERLDGEETPIRSIESMTEALLAQLRLQNLTEDELLLAEQILGSIDPDGYLRRDLKEIVDDLNKFIAATGAVHTDEETPPGDSPVEPIPVNPWSLSIDQMAGMSIDELARLLERGTAAAVEAPPPLPAPPPANGTAHPPDGPFTLPMAERVLDRIHRLDPPAIGARDLRECLLIQLNLIANPTPAQQLACRVVDEAFTPFARRAYERVMEQLGCTIEELRAAEEEIRSLDPKPGEGSGTAGANYITPDFIVEREGEELLITASDRGIPALRINNQYDAVLRSRGGNQTERTARRFLREKLGSARWFIASIQQRRITLSAVMQAIVELQRPFFLSGPDALRPLIYKDVAELAGVDISTVSRVVNGKYVQTPWGTFELRYFFSEGLETESGEEISTRVVRSRLRELIEEEDKLHPYSDDVLTDLLRAEGLHVARRTVAKYREEMEIPVARLRREL